MKADFLGRGVAFPIGLEQAGFLRRVATNDGEDNIRQSIFLILATAYGERVMRPDFGCGIHDLVFHPNDSTTIGRIAEEVRLALVRWEPRVDVLGIETETRGDGNIVLINVRYRIRDTNNLFNLVYPFYLDRGARP